MPDNRLSYTAVAIALHWLMFALILGAWSLGLYMVDLPLSPQKLRYFSWHKWLGVTIFTLAVIRALWRITHPAPPLPDAMPSWQRRAAAASHLLLYALIAAVPISGWLFSSASGVPVVYFGILPLPDLIGRDKVLAEAFRQTHVVLNVTLFSLVCLHVAAAVRHHVVDRDDVMARMFPFSKNR